MTLTDATYASETFPITINANSGSSATNTVTIKPANGVNPSISGSSISCVIVLNGADYVTIDGSNFPFPFITTRNLTITNTNTGTSSAVVCIQSTGAGAGATNNTIKNTNIAGSTVTATAGTLVRHFLGSTTISITSAARTTTTTPFRTTALPRLVRHLQRRRERGEQEHRNGHYAERHERHIANNVTTGGVLANFEDGIQVTQNDLSVLKHDGTTGTTNTAFGIALGIVPNNILTGFTGSDVVNAAGESKQDQWSHPAELHRVFHLRNCG